MDHPMIMQVERTGYPYQEQNPYGDDSLGNEVFIGDEILVFEDEFFLKEELSRDAIKVLEVIGATHEIAK